MPSPTRYGNLPSEIVELVVDLTKGRIGPDCFCHLDPDVDGRLLPRLAGWRGTLGQVSSAQSHLANKHVGVGDLFIFWGLYRPVVRASNGQWVYKGSPEHRIFGWLQVDEVLNVGTNPTLVIGTHPWLQSHPHISSGWSPNNTVYVAKQKLDLAGLDSNLAGYGVFKRGYRLTAPSSGRPSVWAPPRWLDPNRGGTGLTYNPPERWQSDGILSAACRGQEFVADVGGRPDAIHWVKELLSGAY